MATNTTERIHRVIVQRLLRSDYSFGAAFGVTAAVLAAGLVTAFFSAETRQRTDPADRNPDPSPGTSG